jgi:DNA replication protein DnaC
MADNKNMLLRANLKQLKLPAMGAEFEKLAREAGEANEGYEQYLLRLTELEVAARASNAVQTRTRAAGFPVAKDFDTFDFSAVPSLSKPKVLELARGEWIEQHFNCCLIGNAGTGKTHVATSLGLAACRQGKRVRFFTAAGLVNQLEEAQQQHRLDRFLSQLDRTDLLICDELGYLSFSRAGAELLFQVFADRYERRSLLITSNLAAQDGAEPADLEPRVIGVDDWAWRKGQVYGTIVIDLERGRVLDILPGRDGTALTAWLKQHPSVQVISRDRWAAYAQAAQEGAPQAQQVADRWHLLKNLRETMERLFARLSSEVQKALGELPAAPTSTGTIAGPDSELLSSAPASPVSASASAATKVADPSRSLRDQARAAKRQARLETFQRVRTLREQKFSLRRIARLTGLNLKTVRKFCSSDSCPDWKSGRRGRSQLQPFATTVNAWLTAGGQNAAALFRQLQVQGCRASYDAVRRFVKHQIGSERHPNSRTEQTLTPPTARPSARQLSFTFIRRPEKRNVQEQARMGHLQKSENLRDALELATDLADMVRRRSSQPLAVWLTKAEQANVPELRGLAASIRQDERAVSAALTEAWNNGPVEGHVNRLKLIKRQMYGRAGFRLLKARVRSAA